MFVRVVDAENESGAIEIPVEEDGCILLSTLCAHFPGASGLKYYTSESDVWRAVRVTENKLVPSEGSWADVQTYRVVYPKDSKRKVDDDGVSDSDSKLRRVDTLYKVDNGDISGRASSSSLCHCHSDGTSGSSQQQHQPQCTDIIVLGINFKSTEATVRSYFEQYGELALCEIKRDYNGNSKGFGFIRFKDYDAQVRVLKETHHMIDGRSCQTKIPESKHGPGVRNAQVMRKIFVARLPQGTTVDELRNYFSRYGDVVDVYMSQPFRSFAFVTFRDADCIPRLFSQNHILNGSNLHIGPAEPKRTSEQKTYPTSTMVQYNDWSPGASPHFRPSYSPGASAPSRAYSRSSRGDGKRYDQAIMPANLVANPFGGQPSQYATDQQSQMHPQQQQAMATGQPMMDQSMANAGGAMDFTSMASMLTPAMMATFINLAAAQQQQQTQHMMAAAAAAAAAAAGSPVAQSFLQSTPDLKDLYGQNTAGAAQSWDLNKTWQRMAATALSPSAAAAGGPPPPQPPQPQQQPPAQPAYTNPATSTTVGAPPGMGTTSSSSTGAAPGQTHAKW